VEVVREEDGYNVVAIRCDGCGNEVAQVKDADSSWFEMTVSPLARDKWNAGDDLGEFHFCSRNCFRRSVDDINLPEPAASPS
jgi:DNA-directed RNA polymerase subunit N (RpoN/RPB10)